MTGIEKSKKSLFRSFQTKATAVFQGVAELVTDAVPSRARSSIESEKISTYKDASLDSVKGLDDEGANHKSNAQPIHKNSSNRKKKNKNKESKSPEFSYTANQNVTNISYSNNVHIGPSLTQEFKACDHTNLNKNETVKDDRPPVVLTDEIRYLFTDNTPCTKDHILHLESHIGKNWKTLGLSLKFSPGQLDQLEVNYKLQEEVVFQMLLQWTQEFTDSATLGTLATALWGCDEKDAVLRLSQFKFSKT